MGAMMHLPGAPRMASEHELVKLVARWRELADLAPEGSRIRARWLAYAAEAEHRARVICAWRSRGWDA